MFTLFKLQTHFEAALSTRSDGNMLLIDENPDGQKHREKWLSTFGLQTSDLIRAGLAHSNLVKLVGIGDRGQIFEGVDGLISVEQGVAMSITVADCLPIYFYDPEHRAIGLAHAGWKGIAQNIISAVIAQMSAEFHSNPAKLLVVVGPGIGDCHFEVKDDVAQTLSEYGEHIFRTTDGSVFINLKSIARKQLTAAGVIADSIEMSPLCTYDEKDRYFSRRRDQPTREAMLAIISLKS